MTKALRRLRIAAGLLVALIAVAYVCWPERYAVNGPMLQILFGRVPPPPPEPAILGRLVAPPGFSVTRYASGLERVRLLRVTTAGDLLASQPRLGRVSLIERDRDGDRRADGVRVLASGLDRPHGIDWRDGWLYVAEAGAVRRLRFDPLARTSSGAPEVVVSGLPEGGNHWSRTLRFGPDGRVYVSIGSSCNACVEKDPRRAAIVRYDADGSNPKIFATGLRNAVSFDWRPETGELYATDNGRDLLGDDAPPCELNLVVEDGFYGWPFANGDRVKDPDLGDDREADVARSRLPAHSFRPHNAPLGITFLRGDRLPAAYRGAALVALHGSWNRTRKDGYKVVSLHSRADGTFEERDFLTGFLEGETVHGRPVDVAEGPDGAIYVSDDYGSAVFRVAFENAGSGSAEVAAPAATESRPAQGPQAPPEVIARGRALYAQHSCASCHESAFGRGRPLRDLANRYSRASLAEFFRAPTPPMPVFPLDAADRAALAAYLLQ